MSGVTNTLKSSFLSGLWQFAVLELAPPPLRGCFDSVLFEERADGDWSTLVKENKHQRLTEDEGISPRLRYIIVHPFGAG